MSSPFDRFKRFPESGPVVSSARVYHPRGKVANCHASRKNLDEAKSVLIAWPTADAFYAWGQSPSVDRALLTLELLSEYEKNNPRG